MTATTDSGTAQRGRTVIEGARIVTMSAAQEDLDKGDILIEDGVIVDVAPLIEAGDAQRIEANGKVVIPGLIDSHRHTWQSALHIVGTDWTIERYFGAMRGSFGAVYRPEDVYTGTLLGCAECIDSGTTTLYDFAHLMNSPEHADAAVEALRASGMRAVFAYGNSNAAFLHPFPNEMLIEADDARRVRDEHFSGADDDVVTMALSVKGPDFSTVETTRHDFEVARELGLPITVHVGANGSYDRSVARIADAGLLGPDVLYVHCNLTFDDELQLIADSGGTVSMSAEAEMQFAMGVPPIGRFLAHGLEPGLSTDIPSAVSTDMLGAMRVLFAGYRDEVGRREGHPREVLEQSWPRPDTVDILRFATSSSAKAVGMGDKVGQIAPGFDADLSILKLERPGTFPDPGGTASIVLSTTPGDVDTVMVRGRILKQDGKLVTIDVDHLRADAIASRDYILDASGFEADGDGS